MTDTTPNNANEVPVPDVNKLIAERKQKLAAIREQGQAFPNDFRRDALASDLHARFDEVESEVLAAEQ
ncbi:MAG: lysine--tRNA ligase, partial [Moraxellaceae bacterium]|nr:lysine--tRNA ligase [Moraxellaceae bacterium]